MPNTNENTSFWVKVGLYVMGSILGVAAKLATMQKERDVTIVDVVVELCISAAACFLVWSFFHFKLKEDDLVIVASVIVGRYGDKVLLASLNRLEKIINRIGEK